MPAYTAHTKSSNIGRTYEWFQLCIKKQGGKYFVTRPWYYASIAGQCPWLMLSFFFFCPSCLIDNNNHHLTIFKSLVTYLLYFCFQKTSVLAYIFSLQTEMKWSQNSKTMSFIVGMLTSCTKDANDWLYLQGEQKN